MSCRPTSTPRTSSTWRCSTASTSGSRCVCGLVAPTPRLCATWACRCALRRARRCGLRSAPSSPNERVEDDLSAAGLEIVDWLTDPRSCSPSRCRARREAPMALPETGTTLPPHLHPRPPAQEHRRATAVGSAPCGSMAAQRWSWVARRDSARRPLADCTSSAPRSPIADVNAEKGEALALRAGDRVRLLRRS